MDKFFEFQARGDKWVPYHTVRRCLGPEEMPGHAHPSTAHFPLRQAMCEHELLIADDIYKNLGDVPGLMEREKWLTAFLFRGTSCSPLFRTIFVPLFTAPEASVPGIVSKT